MEKKGPYKCGGSSYLVVPWMDEFTRLEVKSRPARFEWKKIHTPVYLVLEIRLRERTEREYIRDGRRVLEQSLWNYEVTIFRDRYEADSYIRRQHPGAIIHHVVVSTYEASPQLNAVLTKAGMFFCQVKRGVEDLKADLRGFLSELESLTRGLTRDCPLCLKPRTFETTLQLADFLQQIKVRTAMRPRCPSCGGRIRLYRWNLAPSLL